MRTATDFPDPGMIDHLRELAAAEPFKPFTIQMQSKDRLHVKKASHIQFTAFGSPKVYDDFNGRWYILNVDAIVSIHL